jgi:hypothetical protein
LRPILQPYDSAHDAGSVPFSELKHRCHYKLVFKPQQENLIYRSVGADEKLNDQPNKEISDNIKEALGKYLEIHEAEEQLWHSELPLQLSQCKELSLSLHDPSESRPSQKDLLSLTN